MNRPVNQQPKTPPPPPPAIVQVNNLFVQNKRAIEDALPKHLTAERMMRIGLTELRKTPKLQQCDPMSFLGAIVQASQLGLEPGSALGHCHLITYGRECQLQIGYRGMIDLARRSGNIISLTARVVCEGDDFDFAFGTEEYIKHTVRHKTDKVTHVYAVAKLKDGGIQMDVMPLAEVEHIRDTYSSSYRNNPKTSSWTTAFGEMAKKTIVRRLFKMLPTSIEIRDAIRVDEDDDQHNAKILDANYEVAPALVDMSRFEEVQNSTDAPLQTAQTKSAAETDKRVAVLDFEKQAIKTKGIGGDPEKILGRSIAQILMSDATAIQVATDQLFLWDPQK